jgi:hypothetical protein
VRKRKPEKQISGGGGAREAAPEQPRNIEKSTDRNRTRGVTNMKHREVTRLEPRAERMEPWQQWGRP